MGSSDHEEEDDFMVFSQADPIPKCGGEKDKRVKKKKRRKPGNFYFLTFMLVLLDLPENLCF